MTIGFIPSIHEGTPMPLAGRGDRIRLAGVRNVLLMAALSALLSACAGLGYRDAGERLTTFAQLPGNPQVRYAPGAESFAKRVAVILPTAVAQVEAMQYRHFRRRPVVYVCNNDDCFHRFVAPGWNYTAAVVYDNRLILASRLFDREPHRLQPILLHELSHLHMGQFRGHYTMAIPVWFHEGLASLVASGGGADLATDADAHRAAERGRHFLADEQHLPWQRTRADAWDLPVSLFYRQAMLYLEHLRSRDPAAFRHLIRSLQNGADFDAAFAQTYQANPGNSVRAYFHSAAPTRGALP